MGVNKKYYWFKFKDDFFRDKKIKKLRKIAGGDTYTIIYLEMQLLSLQNGGVLIFEGVEETFAEELALELDEDVENVKVTLMFLMKNGLIEETEADHYILPETINNIGSETASTIRSRKSRMLKAEKIQKALQCNTDATNCNIEIDKEKDKDIDIKKDKENKTTKYFENENLNSLFIEFLEVRKKLKAVNSTRAINTLIKTLNKYSDDVKYQMIENSIVNSWKGVYELKTTTRSTRKEVVPEWLDKQQQREEATPEEIKELEDAFAKLDEDWRKEAEKLQQELNEKY
jgi:predicted phage replisome organizer